MLETIFRGLLLERCSPRIIQKQISGLMYVSPRLPEDRRPGYTKASAEFFDTHELVNEMRVVRELAGLKNGSLSALQINEIMSRYWGVISKVTGSERMPILDHFPLMVEMGLSVPACPDAIMINPHAVHVPTERTVEQLKLRDYGLTVDLDTDEKMAVFCLAHEARHSQQAVCGRLRECDGNSVFWDDTKYTLPTTDTITAARRDYDMYAVLPWELDANISAVHAIEEIWA